MSDCICLLKKALFDNHSDIFECIISSIADLHEIFHIDFEASTDDLPISTLNPIDDKSPFIEKNAPIKLRSATPVDEIMILAHLRCLELIKATISNFKVLKTAIFNV